MLAERVHVVPVCREAKGASDVEVPVGPEAPPPGIDGDNHARGNRMDAGEHRAPRVALRSGPEHEASEHVEIRSRSDARIGEESLDLRGEHEVPRRCLGEVQGLQPYGVPGQYPSTGSRVVHRGREVSQEVIGEPVAEPPERSEDELDVRPHGIGRVDAEDRGKARAVVDPTIEDCDVADYIDCRLNLTDGLGCDAVHTGNDTRGFARPASRAVRTAVSDRLVRGCQDPVLGLPAGGGEYTDEPTHVDRSTPFIAWNRAASSPPTTTWAPQTTHACARSRPV